MQAETCFLQRGQTFPVGIAACGVCRPVGAVAPDGEDGCAGNTGDTLTGRESQFLVPPAEAFSGEADDRLAAGDEGEGLPVSGMAFQNVCEKTPGFPRLTGEPVGQIDRFISELFCGGSRRGAEFPDRAVDLRLDIVQFLRGLLLQQRERLRREGEMILLHHRHGVGAGAAVGVGGTAGDAVQGITENVAEDDAEDPGRLTGQGETSALDGGETLADAVHLHDVRAAGQHLTGDVLQLFSGNQGQLEESAAAAGEQKDHRVIGAETVDQVQRFFCRREAVLIRDRMAGFKAADTGKLASDMVIFGDDHAVVNLAERVECCLCHLPGCLADRDQQGTPLAGTVIPQGALHGGIRQHRGKGGADDFIRIPAEGLIHDRASCGLFTTLMGSPST